MSVEESITMIKPYRIIQSCGDDYELYELATNLDLRFYQIKINNKRYNIKLDLVNQILYFYIEKLDKFNKTLLSNTLIKLLSIQQNYEHSFLVIHSENDITDFIKNYIDKNKLLFSNIQLINKENNINIISYNVGNRIFDEKWDNIISSKFIF